MQTKEMVFVIMTMIRGYSALLRHLRPGLTWQRSRQQQRRSLSGSSLMCPAGHSNNENTLSDLDIYLILNILTKHFYIILISKNTTTRIYCVSQWGFPRRGSVFWKSMSPLECCSRPWTDAPTSLQQSPPAQAWSHKVQPL